MEYIDFYNYFESLCVQHNLLLHTADDRKIYLLAEDMAGTNVNYPCCIFIPQETQIFNINDLPEKEHWKFELLFVKDVKQQDVAGQNAAYATCKGIVDDFISKIKADVIANLNGGTASAFINDIATITTYPTGPVWMDNAYGWALSITIIKRQCIAYNPLNWNV